MAAGGYFGFPAGGNQFGSATAQPFHMNPQGQGPFLPGQSQPPQPFGGRGYDAFPPAFQGPPNQGFQYGYGRPQGPFDENGPAYPAAYPPIAPNGDDLHQGRNDRWNGNSRGFRGGRGRGGRGRGAGNMVSKSPAPVHYCDVCRVSCAGSQTYEEHLKGTKHQKKEAALKAGPAASLPRGGSALHCDVCDVACTGSDAYAAHIRGAKHQRVVRLHKQLGKPIPSLEPTIITNKDGETAKEGTNGGSANDVGAAKASGNVQYVEAPTGEKVAVPKLPVEQDFEPIGENFIEGIKDSSGKLTAFKCTLCDCQFNDLNAKDMHLKGRRHRGMYKRKIDPTIELAPKAPSAQRREMFGGASGPPPWANPDMPMGSEWNNMGPPMMGAPFMPFGPPMPPPTCAGPMLHTINDRFVLQKVSELALSEKYGEPLFHLLGHVEKAMKRIIDSMKAVSEDSDKDSSDGQKLLKGAIRVGDVAGGLLMDAEPRAELVLLCSVKPTQTLLKRIINTLPKELEAVGAKEGEYTIIKREGSFDVIPSSPGKPIQVTVTLTSPLMRQDAPQAGEAQGEMDTKGGAGGSAASATPADPPDVLDREKCLEALAQLRHCKWFQVTLGDVPPAAITIRILRDLKNREPIWGILTPWMIQLIVHKAFVTVYRPIAPGDVFKRVLELISAGLLLPGGQGLRDPCEREVVDAFGPLTAQQREDLTFSAQTLLRMFCFRKVNKILGMERSHDEAAQNADEGQEKTEQLGVDPADGVKRHADGDADAPTSPKKPKVEPEANA